MLNRTYFFRAKHENEVEAQRSQKLPIKQKCQSCLPDSLKRQKGG